MQKKVKMVTAIKKFPSDSVKPLAWASNGNEPMKNRLKIIFFIR